MSSIQEVVLDLDQELSDKEKFIRQFEEECQCQKYIQHSFEINNIKDQISLLFEEYNANVQVGRQKRVSSQVAFLEQRNSILSQTIQKQDWNEEQKIILFKALQQLKEQKLSSLLDIYNSLAPIQQNIDQQDLEQIIFQDLNVIYSREEQKLKLYSESYKQNKE